MAEKGEAVFFDERHLETITKKMKKLRREIETLTDLVNRSESEFQGLQREFFKVQVIIKEQNANIPTT
jgi:uncharacterized protein YigA (DUF484 family)